MMAFFIIKKLPNEAAVTCLIMVASTLYTVIFYEEVYDYSSATKKDNGSGQQIGSED
jgi:hypothetical protein